MFTSAPRRDPNTFYENVLGVKDEVTHQGETQPYVWNWKNSNPTLGEIREKDNIMWIWMGKHWELIENVEYNIFGNPIWD